MKPTAAQNLIDRLLLAEKNGQRVEFQIVTAHREHVISAESCADILEVYNGLSEEGRRKILDRYAVNPAGLAVFCQRLLCNYDPPAKWPGIFRTTFETCIESMT